MNRYVISRRGAAHFLRITQRSLDRYIRRGRLSAVRVNGRIFLEQKELDSFKKGKSSQSLVTEPLIPRRREQEPLFHQKLYEQTLTLIEEKEKKLQAAQYRIGQLESQMPNIASFTVKPLAHGENADLKYEQIIQQLQEKMKRETLNRKILAAILYLILLLQPILWYLLRTPPA